MFFSEAEPFCNGFCVEKWRRRKGKGYVNPCFLNMLELFFIYPVLLNLTSLGIFAFLANVKRSWKRREGDENRILYQELQEATTAAGVALIFVYVWPHEELN